MIAEPPFVAQAKEPPPDFEQDDELDFHRPLNADDVRPVKIERDASGEIIYPETDFMPMSWTTQHYQWLIFLKEGFEALFKGRSDIFIAGDVLWYPVEGRPDINVGPDVMLAFGRPSGDRTSYMNWQEEGTSPQVVFEVLSRGNTAGEMVRKQAFYDRYGVEEYYIFNPKNAQLQVWLRSGKHLIPVDDSQGFVSPLLGVTFWTSKEHGLSVVLPDGSKMLSPSEQAERADQEKQRADQETQRADDETQRADKLAAKLRELGIGPAAL